MEARHEWLTGPRPIQRAWLSTDGSTGASTLDEFAQESQIIAAIRERPESMLSVDLPHYEPAFQVSRGDHAALLTLASEHLEWMKKRDKLRCWNDVVVIYEVHGPDGRQLGATFMLPTDAVWDEGRNPAGWIIPSERVFPDKLRNCLSHLLALRHFVSSVLLLTDDADGSYVKLLEDGIRSQPLQAEDVDRRGNRHRIWPVVPGDLQRRLRARLHGQELVVADGNHRCAAARQSPFGQFLGVVMAAQSIHILPYSRLVTSLGMDPDAFLQRLGAAGFAAARRPDPLTVPVQSTQLALRLPGRSLDLTPPVGSSTDPLSRLGQWVIDSLVLRQVLGMDPTDRRVRYRGGNCEMVDLQADVDRGDSACAIVPAPVAIADFMELNRRRLRLPAKSTWFRPKVRTGLVVAEAEFQEPRSATNLRSI